MEDIRVQKMVSEVQTWQENVTQQATKSRTVMRPVNANLQNVGAEDQWT